MLGRDDHSKKVKSMLGRDNNSKKVRWRVNFDYECKEKCDPFTKPRLDQIPALIGLSYRCGYLYQAL
jgi:hypothetical protein